MFEQIITIISDIVFTVRISRPLEYAGLFVVLMLMSSPPVLGTALGGGVKWGIFKHILAKKAGEED